MTGPPVIAPSARARVLASGRSRPAWPVVRSMLGELLAGRPDVWRSLVSLVEPLDRHDRVHHTDLMRTLEAFLDSGFSTGATAEKLGIHRHTVAYRLKQIEHLLGRGIQGGEDRLMVELAVQARKLSP